jgi:AcrR family transcriptional regulator
MKRARKYKDAEERKARLLKTAAGCFARHGYEKAGLREICAKAGANLAAIKYYFTNKRGLYREVLISSHSQMIENEAMPMPVPGQTAEEALRQWVHFFLRAFVFKQTKRPQLALIIAREMIQPTSFLGELVTLFIRPIRDRVLDIVTALTGPELPAELRQILCHNVIGACLHYDHAHLVLERLGFQRPNGPGAVARLGDLLADFILGGIRHCVAVRAQPGGTSHRRPETW